MYVRKTAWSVFSEENGIPEMGPILLNRAGEGEGNDMFGWLPTV